MLRFSAYVAPRSECFFARRIIVVSFKITTRWYGEEPNIVEWSVSLEHNLDVDLTCVHQIKRGHLKCSNQPYSRELNKTIRESHGGFSSCVGFGEFWGESYPVCSIVIRSRLCKAVCACRF